MQEAEAIEALAALAHSVRLRSFRALVVAGAEGMTPGALQSQLGIPATTLSFHLKELVRAGLAKSERASRNLVYRAEFSRMNALIGYLTENCCQGTDCQVQPSVACRSF